MKPNQRPINANKREIPIKKQKVIVQARVDKQDLDRLKRVNANVSEIIRQALKEAADGV